MRPVDALALVWNDLWQSRVRTVLTAGGVAIGTAAIVLMVGLGVALQSNVMNRLATIQGVQEIQVMPGFSGMGLPGLPSSDGERKALDGRALRQLRALPGVTGLRAELRYSGSARLVLDGREAPVSVVGVSAAESAGRAMVPPLFEGIWLPGTSGQLAVAGYRLPEDFRKAQQRRAGRPDQTAGTAVEAAAGNGPSLMFGSQPGRERLPLLGRTPTLYLTRVGEDGEEESLAIKIRIVGVLAEQGAMEDHALYLPLQSVADLNEWAQRQKGLLRRNGYDAVRLRVAGDRDVDRVTRAVQAMGYMAFSQKQLVEAVGKLFHFLQIALGAIGFIALLVSSLGIANTMVMAIYERTREIGIMKVVGASLGDVRRLFLLNSALLGGLGGLAGLALSYVAAGMVNLVARVFLAKGVPAGGPAPMLVLIPAWLALLALMISVLVGVAAGLIPARRAANLSPLAAIRQE